jgi:hypothetical protein
LLAAADGNSFQLNSRVPSVDFKRDVTAFLGSAYEKCGTWRPHGVAFRAPSPPPAAPAPTPAPATAVAG